VGNCGAALGLMCLNFKGWASCFTSDSSKPPALWLAYALPIDGGPLMRNCWTLRTLCSVPLVPLQQVYLLVYWRLPCLWQVEGLYDASTICNMSAVAYTTCCACCVWPPLSCTLTWPAGLMAVHLTYFYLSLFCQSSFYSDNLLFNNMNHLFWDFYVYCIT